MSVSMNDNDTMCLLGDFNQLMISWRAIDRYYEPATSMPGQNRFLDLINYLYFKQISGIVNDLGRQLDLVFVSNDLEDNVPLHSVYVSLVAIVPVDNHFPPLEIKLQYSHTSSDDNSGIVLPGAVSTYNFARSCTSFPEQNLKVEEALRFVAQDSVDISLPSFTIDDVRLMTSKLKPFSASGPNNIPGIVIVSCIDELASLLASIFNNSLRTGFFPDLRKKSWIFPVYKKGDRTSISNYRAISMLCAPNKLFELFVHKHIMHGAINIFTPLQYGFLPGRSTVTNLLQFLHFTYKQILLRVPSRYCLY